MNLKVIFLACASMIPVLAAEMDGKQLYTMYCGACHGINGEGGAGDAAPPVANSPWVQGDPVRPIKILLHGVKGELTLAGKNYNLMMPPQGGMLKDEQIAAILTYVRGSMGNEKAGKPALITAAQVAQVRADTKDQSEMYDTKTLAQDHPLPKPRKALSPLKGLVMHTFYKKQGVWQAFPDIQSLESDAVEEEHKGLLSLKDQDPQKSFAVLWEGRLDAQKEGTYVFSIQVDDGLRIYVNDTLVVSEERQGPVQRKAKTGEIILPAGQHEFRAEYWQAAGEVGLNVSLTPPGGKPVSLTEEKPKKKKSKYPTIELKPENGEAVSYRNFMEGHSPRAICYGYPEGVNLLFSQEHANVQQMWKGKFIDTGLRWTGRGVGRTKPFGTELVQLTRYDAIKLTVGGAETGISFWKTELDQKRFPTFFSRAESHPGIVLKDRYEPMPDGSGFTRTLEIMGEGVSSINVPIKEAAGGTPVITTPQAAGDQASYLFNLSESGKTITFHYTW